MSDSLARMTAAGRQITIGGKTYTISPLTFRGMGLIEEWINQQVPDARAIAREMIADGLPDSIAEKVAMEAFRIARNGPIRLNTPEAIQILGTPAGTCQVLYQSLKKHQPSITIEDVEGLLEDLTPADIEAMEDFIYGGNDDPKSATTTTPPKGRESRRRGGKSSTR